MTFNGGVAVLQYYSITNKGREFENMKVCRNTRCAFFFSLTIKIDSFF